jgi:lipopolysaccharide transport system permease protein
MRSEFKGRYARSRIGAAWFVLHPLAQATIFTVVLSEVLSARLPGSTDKSSYALYLMSGIAAWSIFAEISNRCTGVFIEFSGTLKKISFPRIALPVIVSGTALINHALLLLSIFTIFLFFGKTPGIATIFLPIGLLLIVMLALGLGLILGILNVFSRDVAQVTNIVFQFWFWLTPIVYVADILPAQFKWFVEYNPMSPLVGVYQQALVWDKPPDWQSLAMPAIVAFSLLTLALFLFRSASADLVDEL